MATGAAPTPSGLFLPGPPASLTVELTDDWLEWDDYIEVGGMLGANLTYTGVTLFRNSDAGAAHTVAVLETAMWDVYELTFNIDRVSA